MFPDTGNKKPDEFDTKDKCREAALRLLERRQHSSQEIRQKLYRKGFTQENIDQTTEDLKRVNLLNDEDFAREYCREKLLSSRPPGPQKLVYDLRNKGVAPETAAVAVEEIIGDDETEFEHALAAAQWKVRMLTGREEERKRRQKLYQFLMRKGYSSEAVNHAVQTVLNPEFEEE